MDKTDILTVLRFNEEYFEREEILKVTCKNNEEITGKLICMGTYDGNKTITLDVSEKFNRASKEIYIKGIVNIERLKES